MPITRQVSYTVVFDRLHVDALKGTATAYFKEYLDDVEQPGEIAHNVGPDIVVPLLTGFPDPTMPRGAEIARAIYTLAIDRGWFVGDIS